MLDTMLDTCGDELDIMAGGKQVEVEELKKVKKPAPWCSRSSGIGDVCA